ncbi:sporulation stage III protein AG [Tissierella creatinini]|nr:sporulation stage III protein AG [Tissierella creatinini]TJX69091.1 sporulation stage III protein AG [Soehngenia saccharolytica]
MEELINKIKKHLEELNNKKFINNLFIILLLSVIVLIGISLFKDNTNPKTPVVEKVKEIKLEDDYSTYLETKLENILGKLDGVGEVSVMITLEESIESVPASNTTRTVETTKEIDAQGGTREVNREDTNVQIITSASSDSTLLLKEINPLVKGVIVVADGAEDIKVLEMLYDAVKTVLSISGNRVQVYSSK